MAEEIEQSTLSERFIGTSKFLLCVLLILTLSACCSTKSPVQMPPPPVNLSSPCAALSSPPSPMLDPDRLIWEVEIVSAYGDCAARHRLSIEAWKAAVKPAKN